MIAFLTQYYRGLGHSNRIKLIAEKTGADAPVVVIDQLFNPPLNYQVPQEAILKDFKTPCIDFCGLVLESFDHPVRN